VSPRSVVLHPRRERGSVLYTYRYEWEADLFELGLPAPVPRTPDDVERPGQTPLLDGEDRLTGYRVTGVRTLLLALVPVVPEPVIDAGLAPPPPEG
jgi:hypothetical protein